MRDAFIQEVSALAAADRDVMLLTGDLGFGVLTEFAEKFPDQYLNVGVAEQNLTGIAAGLAMSGKRVFTYSIANFPTLRCLEQIRNDVCYHDLNVTVVAIGGGLSYGPLGFSHQATEDLAVMRALPNMVVVAPGHDREAAEATRVLAEHGGPAYLRLDRSAPLPAGLAVEPFRLGRLQTVLASDRRDVLMLSTGAMLETASVAAAHLDVEGTGVTLVNCSTIKPFDRDGLQSLLAHDYPLVVTVEEHSVLGGLGSTVAEETSRPESARRPPILRIGLDDVLPSVVGSQSYLREAFGLDAASVASRVRSVLDAL